MLAAALGLCLVAAVPDGDTIHCADGARLRLAAIDAPETRCRRRLSRSACRRQRAAAAASQEWLEQAAGAAVRWRAVDAEPCWPGFQRTDRWGRIVARAYAAGGADLSALQLAARMARTWRARCR